MDAKPSGIVQFGFCTWVLIYAHISWGAMSSVPHSRLVRIWSLVTLWRLNACISWGPASPLSPGEDRMVIVGRGWRVPGMGRSLSELNVQSGQGSAELGSMATGEITNQGLPPAAACALSCSTVTPACLREQRKCIGLAVPRRSFSAVATGAGSFLPVISFKSSGPAGLWLSLGPDSVND